MEFQPISMETPVTTGVLIQTDTHDEAAEAARALIASEDYARVKEEGGHDREVTVTVGGVPQDMTFAEFEEEHGG